MQAYRVNVSKRMRSQPVLDAKSKGFRPTSFSMRDKNKKKTEKITINKYKLSNNSSN